MRASKKYLVAAMACTVTGVDVSIGQTSSEAPSAGESLAEVVITAQRREETVQKSSLAIAVIGADQLGTANVSHASDLNGLVPGLQLADGGNTTQIFIRGVGDFSGNALANPGVAFNVDGVYVPRAEAINVSFFDVQRIEVLKGPQGTLYGRNTTGGAINLVTTAPTLDAVTGFANLEFGDYALKHFEGAVNVPLTSTLAIRASANVVDRNGYLTDGTYDDVKQAGRIRLLWEPSESFSLLLNAQGAHEGGMGPGTVLLPRAGSNPWEGSLVPTEITRLNAQPPLGFLLVDPGTPYTKNHFYTFSAEAKSNLGFATLTVLPAYEKTNADFQVNDGFLAQQTDDSHSTSVEARLDKATDRYNWVAGIYHSTEHVDTGIHIFASPVLQNVVYQDKTSDKTQGVFGQGTIAVMPGTRLIAGVRYSKNDRTLSGDINNVAPNFNPLGQVEAYASAATFNSVTWKAGVERDLTEDNMLFFTASTGFKSGGLNQTVAPLNVYKPEKLTAFELGSRNRLFGNRLQVNLEVFDWHYKDQQESNVALDPTGQINFLTQNTGVANLYGFDLDAQARVTSDDTFRMTAEYNHTRYSSFAYSVLNTAFGTPIFNPASTGCATGPVTGDPATITNIGINCAGLPLPRAPVWAGTAGYDHRFAIGDTGSLDVALSGQFGGPRYLAIDFTPVEHVGGYAIGNADVTYTMTTSEHTKWRLGAFCHNFSNAVQYTGGIQQPYAPPLFYADINPPRTFGARIGVDF